VGDELSRLRYYQVLVEKAGDVLWALNAQTGRFTYISPSILQLRGLTVDEALSETMEQALAPASYTKVNEQIAVRIEMLKTGDMRAIEPFIDVYDQPCKDGTIKHIEISTTITLGTDGSLEEIIGVSRDATPRVEAQRRLAEALAEKELLLSELAHRVKNSLAITASFLSLEEPRAKAPADAALFRATRDRVRALAVAYDMMAKSSNVSQIGVTAYLRALVRSLVSGLGGGQRISFDFIGDEFLVPTKLVISAGLAVNELITNAMKYAFPSGKGTIRLEVARVGDNLEIVVSDDGVGLPEGFDRNSVDGIGLMVVGSLMKQERGAMRAESAAGKGTSWRLSFPFHL
jgi:PAS domain S-box-containing protein